MRRLPFLNGVRAFEAAARTGSFAKAADELHVTPAAISRLVHLLEERLGAELFERKANRLAPTPAGRTYQAGLTPLFDALANLTAQVSAMGGARVLTVGVGPTFAIRWLIPRLAEFQKVAPDMEVRFATGGAAAPFSDDWTCGITLGNGDWPGLVAERLFAAEPDAGLRAGAGQAAEAAGRPAVGDLAAGQPRARGLAALDPGALALQSCRRRDRSSSITARRCRRRSTASASPWASAPTSTTIFAPAGWWRRSRRACRRACTGT